MEIKDIPVEMHNGYILIQDIKDEHVGGSNLYIPDEEYNRFAVVLKVGEKSKFNVGDIIIKPIGRTTPIKIDGVIYDCLREGFVFAKVEN